MFDLWLDNLARLNNFRVNNLTTEILETIKLASQRAYGIWYGL